MLDRVVSMTIIRPAAWFADGLSEIQNAWRHHFVLPHSIDELRRLAENGPDPVDPPRGPSVVSEVSYNETTVSSVAVENMLAHAVAQILDRPHALYRAWRDHLALPSSSAELKELFVRGPTPIAPSPGIDPTAVIDFFWPDAETGKRYHAMTSVLDIDEIDRDRAQRLHDAGFVSVAEVRRASPEALSRVHGLGSQTLQTLKTL